MAELGQARQRSRLIRLRKNRYTTPPTRLHNRLPANASIESVSACLFSMPIAVAESSQTYRFSRTPIPLGVIAVR